MCLGLLLHCITIISEMAPSMGIGQTFVFVFVKIVTKIAVVTTLGQSSWK